MGAAWFSFGCHFLSDCGLYGFICWILPFLDLIKSFKSGPRVLYSGRIWCWVNTIVIRVSTVPPLSCQNPLKTGFQLVQIVRTWRRTRALENTRKQIKSDNNRTSIVEWTPSGNDSLLSVEVWKNYVNQTCSGTNGLEPDPLKNQTCLESEKWPLFLCACRPIKKSESVWLRLFTTEL